MISFLTVTYERDFDLLTRLLASIDQFGMNNYIHYIILNDDIKFRPELDSILSKHEGTYKVIHWEEFPEMLAPPVDDSGFGYRNANGWTIQQVLTLVAARKIETEYYFNLNSKDYLVARLDFTELLANGVATEQERYVNGQVDHGEYFLMFEEYFENSYKVLGLDAKEYRNSAMRPHTPAILKTEYVQGLLDYFLNKNISLLDVMGFNTLESNPEWGDYCGFNKTNEYYLYGAWLAKNDLLSTIRWVPDGSICNVPHSYDLRRTN